MVATLGGRHTHESPEGAGHFFSDAPTAGWLANDSIPARTIRHLATARSLAGVERWVALYQRSILKHQPNVEGVVRADAKGAKQLVLVALTPIAAGDDILTLYGSFHWVGQILLFASDVACGRTPVWRAPAAPPKGHAQLLCASLLAHCVGRHAMPALLDPSAETALLKSFDPPMVLDASVACRRRIKPEETDAYCNAWLVALGFPSCALGAGMAAYRKLMASVGFAWTGDF